MTNRQRTLVCSWSSRLVSVPSPAVDFVHSSVYLSTHLPTAQEHIFLVLTGSALSVGFHSAALRLARLSSRSQYSSLPVLSQTRNPLFFCYLIYTDAISISINLLLKRLQLCYSLSYSSINHIYAQLLYAVRCVKFNLILVINITMKECALASATLPR